MSRLMAMRPLRGALVLLSLAGCLGLLACDQRGPRRSAGGTRSHAADSAPLTAGSRLAGRVVGVTDGDTVKVLAQGEELKIRMIGIDAPEKAQPFGKVAKQALSDRIFGREVEVQVKGRDRYGRVLGKLLIGGTDVNLAQIRDGFAWHYADYAKDQFPGDAERYAQAEREARAAGVGLWQDRDPMPPWRWRRVRKADRGDAEGR